MSAVPEVDLLRIRRFCESQIPLHLREEARVEADVRGKSVTILDCRPPWSAGASEWSRVPVAQLRYVPVSHLWTLHWADRNGRWHPCDDRLSGTAVELLDEISNDPTCIFWG